MCPCSLWILWIDDPRHAPDDDVDDAHNLRIFENIFDDDDDDVVDLWSEKRERERKRQTQRLCVKYMSSTNSTGTQCHLSRVRLERV